MSEAIRAESITKVYETGSVKLEVLKGIDLTIKEGEGLVRTEFEVDILAKDYYRLSQYAEAKIHKFRTEFYNKIYFDQFDYLDLYIVEVEFHSVTEAENFQLPELFQSLVIKEVTNECAWTNYSLAKNGKPE